MRRYHRSYHVAQCADARATLTFSPAVTLGDSQGGFGRQGRLIPSSCHVCILALSGDCRACFC